jgi:hypothetical protein
MSNASTPVDQELEHKHRTLWGLGAYGAIAEVVAPLGPTLVAATGIGPSARVLDVAAGTRAGIDRRSPRRCVPPRSWCLGPRAD